ncbi:MAG: VWA domain-containing protein, partial [Planctomycetes bacterium]|nr:VWA domain-containing protein [Planctomycetota bacterium]
WAAEVDGAPLALRAASDAERAARDAAQGFDWSSCGQAVELDAALLFRATAGGGRSHALLQEHLAGLLAPLGPQARVRGIAVGDHPQAHLRPRFVTSLQPSWGDAASLAGFVAEVLADPVEGIDVPDAFEVALQQACELDWRPGATRVVLVLTDVPCHLPENPPYTQVRWQDAVERLREAGAAVIGVHVQGGGRPPSVLRSARAFLDELDPGCVALGGEVPAELHARLAELAARRRPDPAGQALIDALGGWSLQGAPAP